MREYKMEQYNELKGMLETKLDESCRYVISPADEEFQACFSVLRKDDRYCASHFLVAHVNDEGLFDIIYSKDFQLSIDEYTNCNASQTFDLIHEVLID